MARPYQSGGLYTQLCYNLGPLERCDISPFFDLVSLVWLTQAGLKALIGVGCYVASLKFSLQKNKITDF